MSRVREFRKHMRYTQAQMGELLGIPQNTYANYESGSRRLPQEVQEKLGNLGLNLNWLATGTGPMTQVTGAVNATPAPSTMQASGALGVDYSQGLPREVRDAIQIAVQMVEDFISVVPAEKRMEDRVKKGLFVMLVADHLVAGKQEAIPGIMGDLLKAYSGQSTHP